ncbi:hypothetical protein HBB16_20620 [Pseudonocardia sp. MCCB 268]|nr:hypothetical protein [Pseudonocardia cytotoxica]
MFDDENQGGGRGRGGGRSALLLSACGVGAAVEVPPPVATSPTVPRTSTPATPFRRTSCNGRTITFAIEKNIPNWNVVSADGNVFETGMATQAYLAGRVQDPADLLALNTDLMVSADLVNPTTIVYKIKPRGGLERRDADQRPGLHLRLKMQSPAWCSDRSTAGNGGWELSAERDRLRTAARPRP